MERTKYSIIIPCYNGEKTIERALDSIKEQKVNEYEVLIINDGSTDKSKKSFQSILNQMIDLS